MAALVHAPAGKSQAELLAALERAAREAFVASLESQEQQALLYDWSFWRRPKQGIPPGKWFVWLILAGRGFGKTRTAAEANRELICSGRYRRIALVGPTAADVRDVMIEGESGLLNIFPPHQRPLYEPSKRRVTFHNGATATCFSAEEPERLRGPQHDLAWLDEPAAYPDLEGLWKLLVPGLRLGNDPRAILTTTPRPLPFFHDLIARDTTVLTSGSTWENKPNLAQPTIDYLNETLVGTTLGEQELEGILLGSNPLSLWQKAWLDAPNRVTAAPKLRKTIIAIDPASSNKEEACEAGIVVLGLGDDGNGYVLEDLSQHATPSEWIQAALKARVEFKAEKIVYEANMGEGFILDLVRLIEPASLKWFKPVHAVADKATRAQPVAALSQKGKLRMVGHHKTLETQLTTWVPGVSKKSPDRLDAMVHGARDLLLIPGPARGLLSIPGLA